MITAIKLMAVHQYAQFGNNSPLVHKRAVRWIVKYLEITSMYIDLSVINRRLSTIAVVYKPDKEKGIEYYADADFAGGWDQADANNA